MYWLGYSGLMVFSELKTIGYLSALCEKEVGQANVCAMFGQVIIQVMYHFKQQKQTNVKDC